MIVLLSPLDDKHRSVLAEEDRTRIAQQKTKLCYLLKC